ncbi:hypothetical protein ES708_27268 [subsurface metagenome]
MFRGHYSSSRYAHHYSSWGFWGTEPTLTLDVIAPLLPKIAGAFPKLKDISFSTSMIDYKPIARFAQAMASTGLKLNIKVSPDGPAFITDINRFKGAAKIIPDNFFKLVSALQDSKVKVNFHWKATLTNDNIKEMVDTPAKIDEYYALFKELGARFDVENHNANITLQKGSCIPSLAVPGKYTSNDGKDFAQFLRLVKEKGHETIYTHRMKKLVNFEDELGTKKRMFTCSGGDSDRGIGHSCHICHRTFSLDDDRCVGAILKQGEINWDYTHYQQGTIDLIRKYYIVGIDDEAELARFNYVLRNYHDFWKIQVGYLKALIKELALVGQASHAYLDNDNQGTLLALFVTSCLGCPVENILNTANIHLTSISLLRMFGNGAFKEILNDLPKRK